MLDQFVCKPLHLRFGLALCALFLEQGAINGLSELFGCFGRAAIEVQRPYSLGALAQATKSNRIGIILPESLAVLSRDTFDPYPALVFHRIQTLFIPLRRVEQRLYSTHQILDLTLLASSRK